MLADELDYMIGVDTHRDEHVLAVLTAPAAAVVARKAVRANGHGYRETLRLAERYAAGRRAWAIDGTGSYGAGLVRGYRVQWKPDLRAAGLIVYDEDDDDDRYVLVTGQAPTFEIHGWITVREARETGKRIGQG